MGWRGNGVRLAVIAAIGEHLKDHPKEAAREGDGGLLVAYAFEAAEFALPEGPLGLFCAHSDLDQDGAQVLVPLAGGGLLGFARRLLAPRAQAAPRGEVLRRRKDAHVRACLSEDGSSGHLVDTGNLDEALELGIHWLH